MSKSTDNRTVDLTVRVAGITFRTPVLPAASELVFDRHSAERVANSGVGGIVTKTFTSSPEFRIRVRPYQFPLAHFDPALKKSGSFYSLSSPHVEEMDVVVRKNVPEIAQICKKNEIPLIVSFYEKPADLGSWEKVQPLWDLRENLFLSGVSFRQKKEDHVHRERSMLELWILCRDLPRRSHCACG
jgi:hypothetical protein